MQTENQLKVVNKKGCHAELVSASSTHVVSQRQQQRRAWKTPNQVWGDNSLFNNSNNGFTLIELLVVVLIIGILAAVAVPQYQKAVWRSRYASLKPLARAISEAQQAYYLANGEFTSDMDELSLDIAYTSHSGQVYYFSPRHCWTGSTTYCAFTEKIGYRVERNGVQCCTSYYDNISTQICKQESGRETATRDDMYCW